MDRPSQLSSSGNECAYVSFCYEIKLEPSGMQ